jgi:acyl carrier protein
MVEYGARNLVLMGRSGASETAQSVLRELEQAGVRIEIVQGDVSKRKELTTILNDIDQMMPPLSGIIHAAGVLDDGMLLKQTWQRFARVMAAKVDGSWNLHELTSHHPLDFFILFSSGASLMGFAGQGNHAAANAFMDALAYYRRSKELPGVSINWGAWSDVGAAAEHNLEEQEIEALSPQEGLQLLARMMQVDGLTGLPVYAQIGALPVNWSQFFTPFTPGDEPPLFAEIARKVRQQATELPAKTRIAHEEPDLLKRLDAVLPNKRWPLLRDYIREQSALVLGLDRSHAIEPQRPLNELGLDSLMAVELRNKLGKAIGHTLPATLLFEYPTIQALTDYLAQEMVALEPSGGANSPKPLPEGGEEIARFDDLSEDEMAALLMEKLEQIGE